MPKFCTHCQNIGHDVSACQWLYPRKDKDINTTIEKVAQVKKKVPPKRLEWVPLKDNLYDIGPFKAFQDLKQVLIPTVVETKLELTVSPQPQQQTLSKEASLQSKDPATHTIDDDTVQ